MELLSDMVRTKSQVRPTPNLVLPSSGLAAMTLTNTIRLWANLQVQVPQGEVDSNTRLQLWLWQAVADEKLAPGSSLSAPSRGYFPTAHQSQPLKPEALTSLPAPNKSCLFSTSSARNAFPSTSNSACEKSYSSLKTQPPPP